MKLIRCGATACVWYDPCSNASLVVLPENGNFVLIITNVTSSEMLITVLKLCQKHGVGVA